MATIKLNINQTKIAKLLIKWYNKCLEEETEKNCSKADFYADELCRSLEILGMFEIENSKISMWNGEDCVRLELA